MLAQQSWSELANTHRQRGQAASLALTDHHSVATALAHAQTKKEEADRLETAVDEQAQLSRRADSEARTAAEAVLAALRTWAPAHPDLRGITTDPANADQADGDDNSDTFEAWDVTDLTALDDAEPALTLATLDTWADLAIRLAATRAARDEEQARVHNADAAQQASDAADLRRQAAQLRAGKLLPLPRPHWSPTADDTAALGTLLEWQGDLADNSADTTGVDGDSVLARRRALLEVALVASGVLAAALTSAGAQTSTWTITPSGSVATTALDTVLSVQPDHPLADVASAVLSRIALVPSATGTHDTAHLLIGADGTFRAGVLLGDAAAAAVEQLGALPAAAHVGARQRLEAARRTAERLDAQANALDTQAGELRTLAATLKTRAGQTRQRASTFPPRSELARAETARAAAAQQLASLETQRLTAKGIAEAAAQVHRFEQDGWVARTRGNNLPADVEELNSLASAGKQRADSLSGVARRLATQLLPRVDRLLRALPDETDVAEVLARLKGAAEFAHNTAQATKRTVEQLRLNAGQSIAEAQDKHARLTEELLEAEEELSPATERRKDLLQKRSDLHGKVEAAKELLSGAQPEAVAKLHHLQLLLAQPAVAEVLTPDTGGSSERVGVGAVLDEAESDALLEGIERLLTGRRSTPRNLVASRYDQARADVAHTWTLARGDAGQDLPELDLYVLTHADHEYTPTSAAARAMQLAARAERQLAEDEQAALNEFVIGRLPSAISDAWHKLLDWKNEVNSKMRSAAASSGVGVQVETQLRTDLNEADRTVYELCCRVSDADRVDEQKQQVGKALQSLIAAAPGEDMLERLGNAVDIRNWVDVRYLISRPGKPPSRWSPRTGLSGGERRLVVLAPMLAAIAACYDRLGPTGLRLAALDEVPAEVDERGREGLARYLAELDLDLICTSYLWDGSPGAWDGIDAHDLEAGPDETVVAFPMLVRGLLDLPGDIVNVADRL